jgi:hypothetical protein
MRAEIVVDELAHSHRPRAKKTRKEFAFGAAN